MCFFPILAQSPSEKSLPVGFILLVAGISMVFFIPGLIMFLISRRKKRHCSKSVTGTIIDFGRAHTSSGSAYYPIYEYTVDGKTYTSGSNPASPGRMKVGDRRTIMYDPNDPARSYIKGYDNRALSILGIVFMAAAVLLNLLSLFCSLLITYAA